MIKKGVTKANFYQYPLDISHLHSDLECIFEEIEKISKEKRKNYKIDAALGIKTNEGYRRIYVEMDGVNEMSSAFLCEASDRCEQSGSVIMEIASLCIYIAEIPFRGGESLKFCVRTPAKRCQEAICTFINYHEKYHGTLDCQDLCSCASKMFNRNPISIDKMNKDGIPTTIEIPASAQIMTMEQVMHSNFTAKYVIIADKGHMSLVGKKAAFLREYKYQGKYASTTRTRDVFTTCDLCGTIRPKSSINCPTCINEEFPDLSLIPTEQSWHMDPDTTQNDYIVTYDYETVQIQDGTIVPFMVSYCIVDIKNTKIIFEEVVDLRQSPHWISHLERAIELCVYRFSRHSYFPRLQPNTCDLCKVVCTPVLDHDHTNGKFRNWLCKSCNAKAGKARRLKCYAWNGTKFDTALIGQQLLSTWDINAEETMIKDNKFRSLVQDKGIKAWSSQGKFIWRDAMDLVGVGSLANKTKNIPKNFSILKEDSIEDKSWMEKVYNSPQDISDELYETIKTYCLNDSRLLADLMVYFHDLVKKSWNMDCFNYISTPALSMAYFRKLADESILQLKTKTTAAYMKYQSSIRGGICQVNVRDTDSLPRQDNHEIKYFDVNNLYGWAMTQPLPVYNREGTIMHFYDVTVECVNKCDRWNQLPAIPFKFAPSYSAYELMRVDQYNKKNPTRPIKPVRCEKLCLVNGPVRLIVFQCLFDYWTKEHPEDFNVKIHATYPVPVAPFLKDYILGNHEMRQKLRKENPGLADLYKLANNSLYGKMLEDTRKYLKLEKIPTEKFGDVVGFKRGHRKSMGSCRLVRLETIYEDDKFCLTTSSAVEPPTTKNPWVAVAILDWSKVQMFRLFDQIYAKDPTCKLLYMDTDSFIMSCDPSSIETDAVKLGYLKDEYPDTKIDRFTGVGPKQYALWSNGQSILKKAKGIHDKDLIDDVDFCTDDGAIKSKLIPTKQRFVSLTSLTNKPFYKNFSTYIDNKRNWLSWNKSLPW